MCTIWHLIFCSFAKVNCASVLEPETIFYGRQTNLLFYLVYGLRTSCLLLFGGVVVVSFAIGGSGIFFRNWK